MVSVQMIAGHAVHLPTQQTEGPTVLTHSSIYLWSLNSCGISLFTETEASVFSSYSHQSSCLRSMSSQLPPPSTFAQYGPVGVHRTGSSPRHSKAM